MSDPPPRHPLHRFPLVNTSDPNEVRSLLLDVFDARYFDVRQDSRPFHVAWNYARLKQLDLGYAHYNSAVSVGIAGIDMVRQSFSLTGSSCTAFGSRQFTSDPEHSSLIPAGVEARVDRSAGHGELRLRIDATALKVKLGAIIGTPIARNLEFAPPDEQPELHRLPRLLMFLAGQLDCEDTKIPDQVLAEYEQLMMVTFLTANRHNFSHLLDRPQPAPGPWQVRLVEEYIEANWKMPLSIESLAAVTGGSAQHLQGLQGGARRLSHGVRQARAADPGETHVAGACRGDVGHRRGVPMRLSQPRALCQGLPAGVRGITVADAAQHQARGQAARLSAASFDADGPRRVGEL